MRNAHFTPLFRHGLTSVRPVLANGYFIFARVENRGYSHRVACIAMMLSLHELSALSQHEYKQRVKTNTTHSSIR